MNRDQLIMVYTLVGTVLGALVGAVRTRIGPPPSSEGKVGDPPPGAVEAGPVGDHGALRTAPSRVATIAASVLVGLLLGLLIGVFGALGEPPRATTPPLATTTAIPSATTASSPAAVVTIPPVATGCQGGAFLAWDEIIPRNGSGAYQVALKKCQLLWFNSGSVILEGQRLGGEDASRNTVLLYLAEEDTSVQVAIGDQMDLGDEWLAITNAGIEETIAAWSERALGEGNCTGTCDKLSLFEFKGGRLAATNTVSTAAASGPCEATEIGVLTSLQSELWQFGGGSLLVEYYAHGEPERDTILPFDASTTGYRVLSPLSGFVWSYSSSCTLREVEDSALAHIADRIRLGHQNLGLVAWNTTNLFQPIAAGG